MPGSFGPPYRPPCDGWPGTQRWFLGGPFQHRRAGDSAVAVHANSTRVPDYRLITDPTYSASGIPPYSRYDDRSDWPSGGTCPSPGTQPNPSCGAITPGAPPCGPWFNPPTDDRPVAVSGSIDRNTYASASGFTDLSVCHKLGFKNVQAWKAWHGRLSYLTHDTAAGSSTIGRADRIPTDSPACPCSVELEQTTPDGTKYRTSTYSADYDNQYWYRSAIVEEHHVVATRTATVDRYSGLVTGNTGVDIITGTDDGNAASDRDAHLGLTAASAIDWWNARLSLWTTSGYTITITESGGAYTATGVSGGITVATATLTPSSGALSVTEYDESGLITTYTESASFTATGFTHEWHVIHTGTEGEDTTVTVTGALSDPYSAADLEADVTTLLGQWNLADDQVYPWRIDEQATIAPLVNYNEPAGAINPDNFSPASVGTFSDPNAAFYDGSIRGAPLAAGYGPHFDWLHQTWRQCHAEDSTAVPYRYAYGAWSGGYTPAHADGSMNDFTDKVVPGTATQWTWNYDGVIIPGNVPAWAWLIFVPTSGILMGQKWAEIKVPRPSINFARPCGVDRLAIITSTARCATYLAATPARVTLDSATSLVTGDICLAAGIAGVTQGIYQVTKLGDMVYELTTLLLAVPTLPAIPAPPVSILGKLRWLAAPGSCGPVGISAATQSGANVVLTLVSKGYFLPGDLLDFSGVAGLGSGVAVVSAASPTSLTVTGTLSGAYSTGGTAVTHSAPSYAWNDDQPKGDYYIAEWSFNYRDYQERARVVAQAAGCSGCPDVAPEDSSAIRPNQAGHGMPQEVSDLAITEACLPFSVCCPQVICLSPNGESWTNGATYGFPALASDCRYGARWQAAVVQTVDDPLWMAPHNLCSDGAPDSCGWVEDLAGTCPGDDCSEGVGSHYYPRRDAKEARASVPTGAPTMPAGCEINPLTIYDLNLTIPPGGIVLPPPSALGYVSSDDGADPMLPVAAATPWGLYLRELDCVCGGGRFAAEYQLDGVLC